MAKRTIQNCSIRKRKIKEHNEDMLKEAVNGRCGGIRDFIDESDVMEVCKHCNLYVAFGDLRFRRNKPQQNPLKSFGELKHGDKVISPLDNEVNAYILVKNDDIEEAYLSDGNDTYDIYMFEPTDFYRYTGNKEIGEKDYQFLEKLGV